MERGFACACGVGFSCCVPLYLWSTLSKNFQREAPKRFASNPQILLSLDAQNEERMGFPRHLAPMEFVVHLLELCLNMLRSCHTRLTFFFFAAKINVAPLTTTAASWEASERELLASRALWRAHLDLLSNIDELASCVTPLRLADEGEEERLGLLTEDQRR